MVDLPDTDDTSERQEKQPGWKDHPEGAFQRHIHILTWTIILSRLCWTMSGPFDYINPSVTNEE